VAEDIFGSLREDKICPGHLLRHHRYLSTFFNFKMMKALVFYGAYDVRLEERPSTVPANYCKRKEAKQLRF